MAAASRRCASRMPASSASFFTAFRSDTGDFFSSSAGLAMGAAAAAPLPSSPRGRLVPLLPAASVAALATAKLTCRTCNHLELCAHLYSSSDGKPSFADHARLSPKWSVAGAGPSRKPDGT